MGSLEMTKTEPQLYSNRLFDKELRAHRRLLLQTLFLPLLITTLVLWACLCLYWGSTLTTNFNRVAVYAVNLDEGAFGQFVLGGILNASTRGSTSLGWNYVGTGGSDVASRELVFSEQAWAVIQVNANTSTALTQALATGDKAFNAQSAVTIYYGSARNQITTNSQVLPAVLAVLNPILGEAGGIHTAEYLQTNAGNAEAIRTSVGCGACISAPFGMTQVDLVPFNVPPATGSTMVGLIFLLTFTFTVFNILHVNADIIGSKLNYSSAILFRFGAALFAYLVISLSYTLINVAFGVPTDRAFGRAGFLVYWMLNTCTMGALGLPMESLFTVIGMKWGAYFLSFWIVVNVASSFTAFEVIPGFYQYGYAFPFFNSIQAARTIIFGTKSHIGLNFGVLIAWMVAGFTGIAIFTRWRMGQNKKQNKHLVP